MAPTDSSNRAASVRHDSTMLTARGLRSPTATRATLPTRRAASAIRRARVGPARRANRATSAIALSASSAPDAFPANPATYAGESNLWVTQELPRMLEMLPRKRPCDGLVLTRGAWSATRPDAATLRLRGVMRFHNATDGRFDVFVPEVEASCRVLSKTHALDALAVTARVAPAHADDDRAPRADGYWEAYIVPVRGATAMEVTVDVTGFGASRAEDEATFRALDAAWLTVRYVAYGYHGRTTQEQRVVLPLKFPDPNVVAIETEEEGENLQTETREEEEEDISGSGSAPLRWRRVKPGLSVLCVPTHLLCHLDDPVSVVERYVRRHARAGDVLCMGETPLAAMQGRVRHPASVRPGWVARVACRLFNRFSSVATACGMQCLVDAAGSVRMLVAAALAVAARLVGVRGAFYRLAGPQANLIDDVSGQIPPYDQCVTLGPVRVAETVRAVFEKCGMPCAVVDVNDLSRVTGEFQILGKSQGVDEELLRVALLRNPQGNGDQQTPLVLVRHDPDRRDVIVQAGRADERARKERRRRGVKYAQK